jgi:archaellum biogenesis protein FlaJ (TadC family)
MSVMVSILSAVTYNLVFVAFFLIGYIPKKHGMPWTFYLIGLGAQALLIAGNIFHRVEWHIPTDLHQILSIVVFLTMCVVFPILINRKKNRMLQNTETEA